MMAMLFVLLVSWVWMLVGMPFTRAAPETWRTVVLYALVGGPAMLIAATTWRLIHGE